MPEIAQPVKTKTSWYDYIMSPLQKTYNSMIPKKTVTQDKPQPHTTTDHNKLPHDPKSVSNVVTSQKTGGFQYNKTKKTKRNVSMRSRTTNSKSRTKNSKSRTKNSKSVNIIKY